MYKVKIKLKKRKGIQFCWGLHGLLRMLSAAWWESCIELLTPGVRKQPINQMRSASSSSGLPGLLCMCVLNPTHAQNTQGGVKNMEEFLILGLSLSSFPVGSASSAPAPTCCSSRVRLSYKVMTASHFTSFSALTCVHVLQAWRNT